MAIYNFTFNDILVTVDTNTAKVNFTEAGFNSTKTIWKNHSFFVDDSKKEISATFSTWKEDSSGKAIPGTHGSMSTLNKNIPNQSGMGYYDFFNSLQTGNETIGNIGNVAKLARLNNLLENLKGVFGEACPCFNPYNNWAFYHPIQLSVSATKETVTNDGQNNFTANSDATITVTVVNPYSGGEYEYSIDETNWQSSSQFAGLSAGNYEVWARSTTELVSKKAVIVVEALAGILI